MTAGRGNGNRVEVKGSRNTVILPCHVFPPCVPGFRILTSALPPRDCVASSLYCCVATFPVQLQEGAITTPGLYTFFVRSGINLLIL